MRARPALAALLVGFIRRYGWDFPVLRDADGSVGDRYRVPGLPTSFVLDPNGRIVARLVGPQTPAMLGHALRPGG